MSFVRNRGENCKILNRFASFQLDELEVYCLSRLSSISFVFKMRPGPRHRRFNHSNCFSGIISHCQLLATVTRKQRWQTINKILKRIFFYAWESFFSFFFHSMIRFLCSRRWNDRSFLIRFARLCHYVSRKFLWIIKVFVFHFKSYEICWILWRRNIRDGEEIKSV